MRQAGVYRDVLLRRWRNMLGRTMWDFPGAGPGAGYGHGTRHPDPVARHSGRQSRSGPQGRDGAGIMRP